MRAANRVYKREWERISAKIPQFQKIGNYIFAGWAANFIGTKNGGFLRGVVHSVARYCR